MLADRRFLQSFCQQQDRERGEGHRGEEGQDLHLQLVFQEGHSYTFQNQNAEQRPVEPFAFRLIDRFEHEHAGGHDADPADQKQDRRQSERGDRVGITEGIACGRDARFKCAQHVRILLRIGNHETVRVCDQPDPDHGHAAVDDRAEHHVDELLRSAVAERAVFVLKCLVQPEALGDRAVKVQQTKTAGNIAARLHDVFHQHERAAGVLNGGQNDFLRELFARALYRFAQTRIRQRVVFCGKEVDAAVSLAADLRDFESRVMNGLCYSRVVELPDRYEHGLQTARLERGEPFFLGNVREHGHQLNVFPGGHDGDLLLRLLNADAEDHEPDCSECADRSDQQENAASGS